VTVLTHCPTPPAWTLDWDRLVARYEWVAALHACPQDPIYHAEGDVGLHSQMACEALAASPEFRRLATADREIVFAAVLLHDVAKPARTVHESDARITSRGHSLAGEIAARRILWGEGVPFATREAVCGLIRYHQIPFFLIERDDPRRLAFAVSQVARCDWLALVAGADAAGRRCADPADQRRLLENTALFRELCAEESCLAAPRRFASDHSRFLYFRTPGRDPDYLAHDDTRSRVILLSGLPGAGKDRWIAKRTGDLPVISLDALRDQLGVEPGDHQAPVIAAARELARERLRAAEPFVWNATNLSRSIRGQLIDLFAGYKARIEIVYREVSEPDLRRQNRERARPVPDRVIDALLERWTVPDLTEAHGVETVVALA
jgi:predicted kinase